MKNEFILLVVTCLAIPLGVAAAAGNGPQLDVFVFLPSVARPFPTATASAIPSTVSPSPTVLVVTRSPTAENTSVVPTATATMMPTSTEPVPTPTASMTPIPTRDPALCAAEYPTVCIPPPPPDLNCGDIEFRNFDVLEPDRHHFDMDHDGVGCEQAITQ